jgi:hypothetical protein
MGSELFLLAVGFILSMAAMLAAAPEQDETATIART